MSDEWEEVKDANPLILKALPRLTKWFNSDEGHQFLVEADPEEHQAIFHQKIAEYIGWA
jgi:hypothetical protein